jgi:hypothetical protein
MKKQLAVTGLSLAVLLAVGCAKEPTEEIQSVDAALTAARTDVVREYAPDGLEKAEKAASAFHEEIAAQKAKFALSRSYDKSLELAQEAKAAATRATDDAMAAKAKMREEVTALAGEARAALEAAMTELGTAPVGKGNRAEIEAMKSEVEAAQQSLTEMDSEIAAERYREAKVRGDAAIATANRIQEAVRQARETVKSAGGRKA